MDHKLLVNIFKSHHKGSVRTDRIQLCHQDVHFKVLWHAGKDNPADFLSCCTTPFKKIPSAWKKEIEELEKTIWFLQISPYTEAISLDCLIQETSKDALLTWLKYCLHKGYILKADKDLKPYQQIFDSIVISDEGLLLKDECIILPSHYGPLLSTKLTRVGTLE